MHFIATDKRFKDAVWNGEFKSQRVLQAHRGNDVRKQHDGRRCGVALRNTHRWHHKPHLETQIRFVEARIIEHVSCRPMMLDDTEFQYVRIVGYAQGGLRVLLDKKNGRSDRS